MATYFTADWHLGETRFDIMQRPCSSTQEHTEILLSNHNLVVRPEDEVIFVGDACYDSSFVEQISKFNGRKTLIRGNHDRKVSDEVFSKYFERIIDEGDGIEMEYDGIPLWVTHYPSRARKDRFNIVGHVHAVWKIQLNCLNVGVDAHFFRPMPLERTRFYYNAILKFYDEDVWAAYNEPNMMFRGLRGRPGSYLTELPIPEKSVCKKCKGTGEVNVLRSGDGREHWMTCECKYPV